MSTTSVFAELLIVGIQTSVWIILLIFSFVGYDWATTLLPKMKDWAILTTIIVVAIWYTLGIIIDRLANAFFVVFNPKDILLRGRWIRRKAAQGTSDARMLILAKEGQLFNFFEYMRSRIRIMRATVFNLILVTLSALLFVFLRCDVLGCTPKVYFSLRPLA